jgi:ATP-dependent RNA helicase DHR2
MGPRKHMKFDEGSGDGVESNGKEQKPLSKKQLKKLKKQQQKQAVPANVDADSPDILGPLNLARLEALESKKESLSDGDLRFHSSASSDEESRRPQSTPDGKTDPEDTTTKVNGTVPATEDKSTKLNGLASTPKVVYYRDSEDEEAEKPKPQLKVKDLKKRKQELQKERERLPMYVASDQVLDYVLKNQVSVLIGETGSGKSTQLPQLIYNREKNKKIAITQPRRVAAINLATRVAQEMGSFVGNKVGYTVRFQNKAGDSTYLKYLTDGMLLREILLDPTLSRYDTILLDEAHERTVLTDMLMGLIKRLLVGDRGPGSDRPLRLVIMSATLDAQRFSSFFDNAPILYVEGRMHPVQRYYVKTPLDNVVDGVVQTVCQTNMSEPSPGDILVFLAGQEEIDRCVDRLNSLAHDLPKQAPLIVALPLYASLPPNQQQKVFEPLPARRRKVILATNIAETSLTISGVRYVIDSGLRKVRVWKPELGLDALLATHISKASAAQRMGRAGREAPGKCFRLFTEKTYTEDLPDQTEPEIVRCDVASAVLMLKNAGVNDILNFQWVQSPSKKALRSALLKLYTLQALDDSGKVTDLGKEMALLPVSPHLAAVLIHARNQGPELLQAVIDIVACLSVEDLLLNPHPEKRDDVNERRRVEFGGGIEYGDLIMLKEMFDKYFYQCHDKHDRKALCESTAINYRGMDNVNLVRKQLQSYMKVKEEYPTKHVASPDIIKCFLHGFVSNTALGLPDRRYKTVLTNQYLNIHPSSMLFGKKIDAIMYMEYVYTTKGYARIVSPIQEDWLQQIAPHLLARGKEA